MKVHKPAPAIALLLFFISLSLTPGGATAEPLQELAGEFSRKILAAGIRRVCVLDFAIGDKGDRRGATLIRERLTTYLVNQGDLQIIERSLLLKVLEEKSLRSSGLLDDATVTELGRILGADAIITGSLETLGPDRVELNVRVINSTSARILVAARKILPSDWSVAPSDPPGTETPVVRDRPLVQIALLLDTSNSMDGLINQARDRLWNIVNELAGAEQDGENPRIEVALYEYGNNHLARENHYLRQVTPFTEDLDRVSEALFSLTTHGGLEYTGAVIGRALSDLEWKRGRSVYRTVFIAGNEPFTQGPVSYRSSVRGALRRGITVNTIYCGSREAGAATGWLDGARLGGGEYGFINQESTPPPIDAPQDGEIRDLGRRLNQTFIPYGRSARVAQERQRKADQNAGSQGSGSSMVGRAIFKAKEQYSRGTSWDLITLILNKKIKRSQIKREMLPPELRNKSDAWLARYIERKIAERKKITERINRLNRERQDYLKSTPARPSVKSSLDDTMMRAIRKQASEKKFRFQKK